jgi:hypothetical protein
VHDSGRIAGLDPGGGTFGPDGRYYVGMRRARTILAMNAALDGDREPLLPEGIVPFPRGFGFASDGRVYLVSGTTGNPGKPATSTLPDATSPHTTTNPHKRNQASSR